MTDPAPAPLVEALKELTEACGHMREMPAHIHKPWVAAKAALSRAALTPSPPAQEGALEPCPFCAAQSAIEDQDKWVWLRGIAYYVRCPKCHSRTGNWGARESAVVAWNRRAVSPQEGGIAEVERLIVGYRYRMKSLTGELTSWHYSPTKNLHEGELLEQEALVPAAELSRLSALVDEKDEALEDIEEFAKMSPVTFALMERIANTARRARALVKAQKEAGSLAPDDVKGIVKRLQERADVFYHWQRSGSGEYLSYGVSDKELDQQAVALIKAQKEALDCAIEATAARTFTGVIVSADEQAPWIAQMMRVSALTREDGK